MGLFDQIAGAVSGLAGRQGSGNAVLEAVLRLIGDPQTGGLSGLMDAFQKAGLGHVFSSWVSTGENQPISAEQIRSILGSERVQSFASQAGIDADQASQQLAQILPQVVDKLTPDGNLPQSGDLMAKGWELLKGKLFG